jgi:DNA polymerase III subunit epsilon
VIRLPRRSPSWRDASFAVLDFETTGLDVADDHILSYGVVPVEHGRAQVGRSLYRVVRPSVPPSPASIRVHGIRPAELLEAPQLDEVVAELFDALGGRTLVAHAAWVELGFLEPLYRRYGRRPPPAAIDVLELAARAASLAGAEASADAPKRLADIAAACGVPVTRTHHALSDALTTAQVFLVLATRLALAGQGRVRDLARTSRSQIARTSRFGPLDRTRPVP